MTFVNSENFNAEVLASEIPVLVDFFADWCGPCKMIAPSLEELSQEITDTKIVKLNVDDASDIAMQYGVSSIPTLILFKDGKEANKAIGFMSKEDIEKLMKS